MEKTPLRSVAKEAFEEFRRDFVLLIGELFLAIVFLSALDYFKIDQKSTLGMILGAFALALAVGFAVTVFGTAISAWHFCVMVLKRWYCERRLAAIVLKCSDYWEFVDKTT